MTTTASRFRVLRLVQWDNKVSPLQEHRGIKAQLPTSTFKTQNRYKNKPSNIRGTLHLPSGFKKKLEVTWWALLTSVNSFS